MKKILILLLIIIFSAVALSFTSIIKEKVIRDLSQPVYLPKETSKPERKTINNGKINKSLFIPYWTLTDSELNDLENYDSLIYFGITTTDTEINTQEEGFKKITEFVNNAPVDKTRLLTIRMINSQTNLAILKKQTSQRKIIAQSVEIAKEHGFQGILLDFELSAIPFDSLISQISDFNKSFSYEAKKNNLSFSVAIYGDTFYRLRPFDVKSLAKNSDSIFIMAYDFHKANSNPGPNFPLNGKEKYGYDLSNMIDDFLRSVPENEIVVVFGLFGYDWRINEKGDSQTQAEALSYEKINQKFLSNCDYENCKTQADNLSSEMKVSYTLDGQKHIVWFETMESVNTKQKFIKTYGITNFSYWAYSYF